MDLSALRRLLEGDGDPDPASTAELRTGRAVALAATLWFACVVTWEMFGPIVAGHYASSASMGIIAENMHRFRMMEPVWTYTAERPDASLVYCHHPWGIFWTTAWFYEVFGRHDFVCRLPAALLSIATPPILYRLGADIYRPIAGACAAVAFVVLPISLSFAQFNALEVPVVAFGALFLWSWVRARRTNDVRWFVAMTASGGLAMNSDWPAFVLVASILTIEVGGFVAARKHLEKRRALAWIALASTAAVVAGFYLLRFAKLGKLDELWGSYRMRSHGSDQPLAAKLLARRYWIELAFTPVAIAMGKAGAVIALARAFLLRRAEELAPMAVLAMAGFQYVAFPQGADIHVFWPHHFALFFALAVAALVATIAPPIARFWRQAGAFRVTLGLVLLPLAFVLRDGVEVLSWARSTGGRFSEKGAFIETDGDKVDVLRAVAEDLPRGFTIGLHESFSPNWAQVWALGGRVVEPVEVIPPDGALTNDLVIADLRNLREADAARLLFGCEVRAYGPYLVARRGAGFDAFSLQSSEPTSLEWLFRSASEPVWSTRADPFLTWEIAVHYGLVTEWPAGEPASFEQIRVAHNAAVDRGDADAAAALYERLSSAPFRREERDFDGGLTLLGGRVDGGVQPRLTLVFRAGGPLGRGVVPRVRSRVIERAALSTIPPDPAQREVLGRPLIAPSLWRRGWLYSVSAPLLERPGIESFELSFAGPSAPRLSDGARSVEIVRE